MTVAARASITARVAEIAGLVRPGFAMNLDPNYPFDPPQQATWLRLIMRDGDEQQVGMGGATSPFRKPLLAFLDFFGPAGDGDGDVVQLADQFANGLRRWSDAGIGCTAIRSGVEGRGLGDDVALYRKQLIAVFTLSFRG